MPDDVVEYLVPDPVVAKEFHIKGNLLQLALAERKGAHGVV